MGQYNIASLKLMTPKIEQLRIMSTHGLLTNIRLYMKSKLRKTIMKPKSLFKRIAQVDTLMKNGLSAESKKKIL